MQRSLIGQTVGKYSFLEEIGRGGMGLVYKGHDTVLDRPVAIKVLAPHLAWDQEFVQRFLSEARTAARLRHRNIVTIFDVGQMEDYHFIVMDYLEGRPLSALIRHEAPLPAARTVRILGQIAQALDHAHAQSLVHRDVKPGNVIVSPDDYATLTDFGIAKALEGTHLTRTGTLMGTPAYMAPEQIRGQPVTPASDQYALGVVAYEMLGGRPPFEGDTSHVLYAHVHEKPQPLQQVNPGVSLSVGTVVQRALAKERGERYGSTVAFTTALQQAIESKDADVIQKPSLPHPEASQKTVRLRDQGLAQESPVKPAPSAWSRPALQLAGSYNAPGPTRRVFVDGRFAYVAAGNTGLRVVDVSDPADPWEVGACRTLGDAQGVFVVRDHAFIASEHEAGLRVVNVSNPAAPQEVGACHTPGWVEDVFVTGGYAYVADGLAGLQVVDVSEPRASRLVGACDTPGSARSVFVVGGYAFVSAGSAGLRVVNVSNPVAPRAVSACDTPGSARGVFVAGSYAYIADGSAGLRVVDVSNPAVSRELGTCDMPGYALNVFVVSGYAYVAAGYEAGLRVVDVSNPAMPREVDAYDTSERVQDVHVAGSHVYVAAGFGGLFILRWDVDQ